MIQAQLYDLLIRLECEEIDAHDALFDPDIHEAVRQVVVPGQRAGFVVDVVQPGYRLHDRIVRPSKVVVSV